MNYTAENVKAIFKKNPWLKELVIQGFKKIKDDIMMYGTQDDCVEMGIIQADPSGEKLVKLHQKVMANWKKMLDRSN